MRREFPVEGASIGRGQRCRGTAADNLAEQGIGGSGLEPQFEGAKNEGAPINARRLKEAAELVEPV